MELNAIPQEDQERIAEFYHDLMRDYFNQAMNRFIEQNFHKQEFMRSVYTIITWIRAGRIRNDPDDIGDAVSTHVEFFFNQFDGEQYFMAMSKIDAFIAEYDLR